MNRRGQALVEFAVVSLVLYMLLAAILTFGQILYCSQGLQQAADVAAREISRTPLSAAQTSSGSAPITLTYVLYGDASTDTSLQNVRQRVFDDNMLVLKIDATQSGAVMTFNGGHPIGDFPIVTQQLMPVMIYDQVNGQQLLHYPGALFTSTNTTSSSSIQPSGYVVRIPVLTTNGAAQTLSWVSPIEPILDSGGNDAFSVAATTTSGMSGVVALRINYPYQSATMSGFQPPANPASPPGPRDNPVVPILADASSSGSPSGVGAPVVSDFQYGPYAGANGLGQQAAWGKTVRPYRSLISAQAIYRREVFQ